MKRDNLLRRLFNTLPKPLRAGVHGIRLSVSSGDGLVGEMKKRQIVLAYINKYNIRYFVETGTFLGEMANAVRPHTDRVYTIEIDDFLYRIARFRFLFDRRVTVLKGDSKDVLGPVLSRVHHRALFWLDAHYSDGITGKGDLETPIMQELEIIGNHAIKNHIILVDDVRSFGTGDYPEIESVCDRIKAINREYLISIEDDILRVTAE